MKAERQCLTSSLHTYKPYVVRRTPYPQATPCTLAVAQGQEQDSFFNHLLRQQAVSQENFNTKWKYNIIHKAHKFHY